MSITKLPDPLPKVHQCGCGSQAFHLCADGRVVCLQCRYIIESLFVISALQPHVEREAADLELMRDAYAALDLVDMSGTVMTRLRARLKEK